MTTKSLLIALPAVLGLTGAASATLITFEFLDQSFSANDLSPDGRWVVGTGAGGAYIWSRDTGYEFLGGIDGVAVSDDGTVVFGGIDDPATGREAAIWTGGSWTQLPSPPGASGCPTFMSPYELSADGSVAVGLAWEAGACSATGFRWTQATGTVAAESLANGNNRASVVSGDGSLLGGFAQGSFSRTPAIWTADGSGQLLDPPAGDVLGEVHGISDDGTVLLGEWDGKPFKWDQSVGIEVFDGVIASWIGIAMDIADDDTVVGFDVFQLSRRAWIKFGDGATMDLRTYLQDQGVANLPPVLEVCQAVSTSGNIIIGHNSFSNGWIINLCAADLSNNGTVEIADLLDLLGAWGVCPDCVQDLNEDGTVDVSDLLMLLAEWGACP